MNKRLKELRKNHLHLTQQQFADRIKISRNNVAGYEAGSRIPSDAAFSLICREFNVNEEWLRTGEGEIFKEYDDEVAESITEMLTEDAPFYDIIKSIMITYKKLNPDSRTVIDDFIKQAFDILKSEDN